MKKRTDIIQSGKLAHNPFEGLAGLAAQELPQGPEPPQEHPAAPPRPWAVARTRKGGYAISLENRPGGKHVTVLKNVSGDLNALLKDLRKRCGAGGAVREDAIELQGDHQAALKDFLDKSR